MGKSGSGKTSMRSIIFANYIARDTSRLGPTMEVEHAHVRYCFKVFCLIHKMDLIEVDHRDKTFEDRAALIYKFSELAAGGNRQNAVCQCFRSSIWDETLYKAWSAIVYKLIPNVSEMEQKLKQFAAILDADEVMLFERATFLVIAHAEMTEHRDMHRFEKVSNIIKQFKLSCSKMGSQFEYMHVRNSHFAAFIDAFTPNTFIMVVLADGNVSPAATLMNIRSARKHFEALEAK
ncbi:Gtr1/RagA G protein region [Oesophagostomum dentatum]|uniref:Gtr1/RagA G protein region n=1 Tax=Oesophagostomum dentatum TaxID=61180 RepID=A0A0B1TB14_OESDE|nr:Gtr1/RagA G protein region [Oesophagostomum dentatum]